ncbi:rubredoxin, partial [Coprobacillus sp. AM28-15LB]
MFNNRTKRAFKRYYRRINLKRKFMEKYICT